MKVGWLADEPGYVGGAELTQRGFLDAAPEGVEIVPCPVGEVESGLDVYVLHNCVTYPAETWKAIRKGRVTKYLNDVWPHGDPSLKARLLEKAQLVFCSPLHRECFDVDGEVVPPVIDLERFRAQRIGIRVKGTCWLGSGQFYGAGVRQAIEWAQVHGEPIDFYGEGPYMPQTNGLVKTLGHVPYEKVPEVLGAYRRFVFLPTAIEPFGRAVVEAWASGCEVVVNENVGARYYLEEVPEKLESAGEDFWRVALGD